MEGFIPKSMHDIGRDHPFNVTFGTEAEDPFLIMKETHTKVEGDWTHALQLKLVLPFHQDINNLSWILGYDS
jgi:hypothetical protein